MLQNAGVLHILTYKCASRHSGVLFLNIFTSKSGPRVCGVLHILTYKCASRHRGVRFLDIGTSKICPALRFFAHFDLQMCFAPQRRTIFQHRTFKNCSEIVVFCAFWLANVLRATAAYHFSGSQLQKMAPTMRCFEHFDLEMRFAPQRRSIFHLSAEQLPPHPPL